MIVICVLKGTKNNTTLLRLGKTIHTSQGHGVSACIRLLFMNLMLRHEKNSFLVVEGKSYSLYRNHQYRKQKLPNSSDSQAGTDDVGSFIIYI